MRHYRKDDGASPAFFYALAGAVLLLCLFLAANAASVFRSALSGVVEDGHANAFRSVLQFYQLALHDAPRCHEWFGAKAGSAVAPEVRLREGAMQGCLYSTESRFGNKPLSNVELYVLAWNNRLVRQGECEPYAGWALELVRETMPTREARLAALGRLYEDAAGKGCLNDTPPGR